MSWLASVLACLKLQGTEARFIATTLAPPRHNPSTRLSLTQTPRHDRSCWRILRATCRVAAPARCILLGTQDPMLEQLISFINLNCNESLDTSSPFAGCLFSNFDSDLLDDPELSAFAL